jgi:hypothetical protein
MLKSPPTDVRNAVDHEQGTGSSRTRQTLSTALLTGWAAIAALGGAWIGSHGASAVQREQAQEARHTEARAKRTAVYEGFLAAVNADVEPSFRAAASCAGRRCNHGHFGHLERVDGPQSERLVNAYNQVALYGSDKATVAAAQLVNAFPILILSKRMVAQPAPANFSSQLGSAYQTFARIMCEEVSAEPRSKCSKLSLTVPPTLILTKPATEAREHVDGGIITIYE